MKYKILEILPGQIRVEYEDNSWALVPIPPNASQEDIDNAVSQYDPDFLFKPESVINPDIYIGQERESKKYTDKQKNDFMKEVNKVRFKDIGGLKQIKSDKFTGEGFTRGR